MSDADEKKPEDLSFDANSSAPTDDANDFDFSSFLSEESSPSTAESHAEESATEFSLESAESSESAEPFAAFGLPPAEETPQAAEPEFPAAPSSFMTDGEEPASTEPAAEGDAVAAPVVETDPKKKGKKEKKKKEKKEKPAKESGPRQPMDLGAVLCLCLGILMLLGLIGVNALIFTAPATPGIGGSSTIYYAVGVNVFGLIAVAVPFMLWKFRKGQNAEGDLKLFDILLGIALMALAVGVICFLTAFYRYDFTIKAAKPTTPSTVRSVA